MVYIFAPEMIVFLALGIGGIIFLIITLATDTELDDKILIPVLSGLINFGFIGFIVQLLMGNLLITIIIAIAAWAAVSIIIIVLKKKIISDPTDYTVFEGQEAYVEIPFSKDKLGRISSKHSKTGDNVEFPAKAFESTDPEFQKGDKVYIKKISGMVAEVIKSVKWELKKMKNGGENK